ncbi:hypothetical protein ACHAXR_008402 [Thalassiosira sp. AJA248-18]
MKEPSKGQQLNEQLSSTEEHSLSSTASTAESSVCFSRSDSSEDNFKAADDDDDANTTEEQRMEVVCGMPFMYSCHEGFYTGQIDAMSELPHGVGTWRASANKINRSLLVEGEWSYGCLYSKARNKSHHGAGRSPLEIILERDLSLGSEEESGSEESGSLSKLQEQKAKVIADDEIISDKLKMLTKQYCVPTPTRQIPRSTLNYASSNIENTSIPPFITRSSIPPKKKEVRFDLPVQSMSLSSEEESGSEESGSEESGSDYETDSEEDDDDDEEGEEWLTGMLMDTTEGEGEGGEAKEDHQDIERMKDTTEERESRISTTSEHPSSEGAVDSKGDLPLLESSAGSEAESGSEYETDSEEDDNDEDKGGEWLSSSGYGGEWLSCPSNYETEDDTLSKGGAAPNNEEQTATLAQKAMVATTSAEAEVPATVTVYASIEVQEAKAAATTAEHATAASSPSASLQKRVKELEAQLDAESENHVQLEQDTAASLHAELQERAVLEKERQDQLEAQLEREFQLGREQRAREFEFQQRAADAAEEESRALARAQQQQQLTEQQAAATEEQHCRQLAEEKHLLQEEREHLARARLEQEEQHRIQMVQCRIQALREDREHQEERRVYDEHEMQRRVRKEVEQRFLKQKQEMEQQWQLLQQERELEEQLLERERERKVQRLCALRKERDRQQRLAQEEQCRLDEERRNFQEQLLERERERKVQRLRALREERDRQHRLAQEEQCRLDEERRKFQEQRELHQWLERERQHQLAEGQNQHDELNVARAIMMPHPPPRPVGPMPQSNRFASSTLVSRQRDEYNPPSSTASSPTDTRPQHQAHQHQSVGVPQPSLPQSNSQSRASRYDEVDDGELNWRLDC